MHPTLKKAATTICILTVTALATPAHADEVVVKRGRMVKQLNKLLAELTSLRDLNATNPQPRLRRVMRLKIVSARDRVVRLRALLGAPAPAPAPAARPAHPEPPAPAAVPDHEHRVFGVGTLHIRWPRWAPSID